MLARRVGQRAAALRACRHVSSQPDAGSAGDDRPHPHLTYHMGERAIRLRSVERIASPLDALAMVRAVERRFGRVAEYRFHHDQEIPNRFQFVAYLSFWDPATYARVPRTEPILLRVKLPPENTSLTSGGVGLADLTPYLDPKNWTDNDLAAEVDAQFDQSDASTDGSRVLRFHVEHYSSRYQTRAPLPDNLSPADVHFRRFLMANFIRWGGFAPKEPLPETRISASDLVFGGGEVDHPYMRHQLNYWDVKLRPRAVDRPLVLPAKKKKTADNVPAPAPEARLQPEETQRPIQHLRDLQDVVSDRESTKAPNSTDLSVSQSVSLDKLRTPKSPSPSRFPSLAARSSPQLSSTPPPPSPTGDRTQANDATPAPSSSAEPTRRAAAPPPSTSMMSSSLPTALSKASKAEASKPVMQTKPAPVPAAPERRNQARCACGDAEDRPRGDRDKQIQRPDGGAVATKAGATGGVETAARSVCAEEEGQA
ncbi:hypothetical protein MVEN_00569700 [Mycena venus]|uniref:Uncharacterized protein n=1 Tax=Mycena venus TaxID=2733690 RepID=A0A8H6YJE6_9AGAR|nr:hypothetical protein MVEN_00569700 [Mycena venus]